MFGKRRRIREWLWDNYVALLERKGYNMKKCQDSNCVLNGYTLRKGNVIINASELRGWVFTVLRLENTW